jgi:hypothetical protein
VGTEYDAMRNMEARIHSLEEHHAMMSTDFSALHQSMNANTAALQEYIDISQKLKIGLGILGTIERAAVWCTKVGAGAMLIWAAWKFVIKEAMAHIK